VSVTPLFKSKCNCMKLVFAGKAGAYSSLGAPLKGRLLALPTNDRLGCKSLPGRNAPAFYENL
jgi:hypothetical protein